MKFTYFGHSCFLVEFGGKKILFDPFISPNELAKDIDVNSLLSVDESLFEQEEEKDLYSTYTLLINKKYNTYEEELDALFSLKPKLDKFFDNVFVNHENENIKINRKNLIGLVYQAFRNIADIKEITI